MMSSWSHLCYSSHDNKTNMKEDCVGMWREELQTLFVLVLKKHETNEISSSYPSLLFLLKINLSKETEMVSQTPKDRSLNPLPFIICHKATEMGI
ncbi:CLUMA_CG009802, isoform A [Clunio marinus]|uniref:CLUMA_CG009802, isoform A n=1 Tax=Clunio marinus TaxID=568069 RepID=A0A1J1ID63_9DIPT|nr:CLUMA_CG009802, isoform A [Clunio marinus]